MLYCILVVYIILYRVSYYHWCVVYHDDVCSVLVLYLIVLYVCIIIRILCIYTFNHIIYSIIYSYSV